MKKLKWPESAQFSYHQCSICKKLVDSEENSDGVNTWYTPSSRYWNPAKLSVYCSVNHSFEDHLNDINKP
ncbi:MAG: hypothetical protein JWP44_5022 [Mucilaginibacter sp.]|nr:hypothetical protein [Mucilaginibacter sp.]